MHQFKVGDRVRFTGPLAAECHELTSRWFPPVGTVGTVIHAQRDTDEICVKWPRGSTAGQGDWWAFVECLEVVEDDTT